MSKKFSKCDKKSIVSQLIRTQAQVTLKPIAKHGKPKYSVLITLIGLTLIGMNVSNLVNNFIEIVIEKQQMYLYYHPITMC